MYTLCYRFHDTETDTDYNARVVLQTRIRPGTYKIGRETLGAGKTRIDPMFDNSEIEWSTNHRGVIIPTGILIKLTRVEEFAPSAPPSPTVTPRNQGDHTEAARANNITQRRSRLLPSKLDRCVLM